MLPAAARPSARYRSVVVVLLLAFLLLGVFAFGRLPVDLPPSREAPRLNVRVAVAGLTAPGEPPTLLLDATREPEPPAGQRERRHPDDADVDLKQPDLIIEGPDEGPGRDGETKNDQTYDGISSVHAVQNLS